MTNNILKLLGFFSAFLISLNASAYNYYVINNTNFTIHYALDLADKNGNPVRPGKAGDLEPLDQTTVSTTSCLKAANVSAVFDIKKLAGRPLPSSGNAVATGTCGGRKINIDMSENKITVSIEGL